MKVKSLEIKNYRGIGQLKLDFQEQTNILIGDNGTGKSAVLDCLAVLLSRFIGRIRSKRGYVRLFSEQDISNGKSETCNEIKLSYNETLITWQVAHTRRKRKPQSITNLGQIKEIAFKVSSKLEEDNKTDVPLAVYYPVNRAVLEIPLRIRHTHNFDQFSAYDDALTGRRNDFRIFFEWFRDLEDIENEYLSQLDDLCFTLCSYPEDPEEYEQEYRCIRELNAVREAIYNFLPGFFDLKVRRSPLRMVIKKGNKELIVNQLSDGEKCTLAMIGDLARRLAIANPSLENPLLGKAVILIDEIDLHLHPSWQREIVPALQRTFPNCQFILTTHSPQILSHVQPESIFTLKRDMEESFVTHPEGSYGLDSNRVLEDIMEVDERPLEVKEELEQLFLIIDTGGLEKAREKLKKLKESIGSDPILVKADVLIRRMEILKR